MNLASELASGQWIAPLDDDDAFVPDHIEALVGAARAQRAEVVYGNILQHPAAVGEPDVVLSGFPPTFGQYGFQAAVYHADLRFFTYNTSSWMMDEPGDWNLCRRMLEAGVHFGWVDRVVTEYYPSTLHAPRRE
jgi:glycosyltransferase involved in cell wall biosynthesis